MKRKHKIRLNTINKRLELLEQAQSDKSVCSLAKDCAVRDVHSAIAGFDYCVDLAHQRVTEWRKRRNTKVNSKEWSACNERVLLLLELRDAMLTLKEIKTGVR